MQPSISRTSNHSFRLINSKIIKQTHCHGACIPDSDTSLQLNKSKKYSRIESAYSAKNLPKYQPTSPKVKLKEKVQQDAGKRYQFFHMKQKSVERFQNYHSKMVTEQAVLELRNLLQRARSSKSIH